MKLSDLHKVSHLKSEYDFLKGDRTTLLGPADKTTLVANLNGARVTFFTPDCTVFDTTMIKIRVPDMITIARLLAAVVEARISAIELELHSLGVSTSDARS
jgi:hypothetical protein